MEAIVNNMIKATGWSIFHSLWQAAIIYGLLLLLTAVFPRMTAKLKHNLAYGAICLMFAGFILTFCAIFKLPANDGYMARGSKEVVLVQNISGLSESMSERTELLFPYITNIYVFGLLFQLLILVGGYNKLQALKKSGHIPVPQAWQKIFAAMLSRLELPQPIRFYLSDKVNIPLVIGYFKPVVLFPVALVAQLDIKQVEAILIHELSHIRRNDYLLNLIKTAIETLMFFNPFIWLSGRFINIEREHACDDLVLKLTGTPLTYAHALLKLEIIKDKTTPVLSMAANGRNQHLYQRIKRITDMKTNYMNAKQQIFAITLTLATVVSLAWINPSESVVKPEVETTRHINTKRTTTTSLLSLSVPDQTAFYEKHVRQHIEPLSIYIDTPKKKNKFKIVTIDANGNKQEYNSVKEMPDSLRREVMDQTFSKQAAVFGFEADSFLRSNAKTIKFSVLPEWKKQMVDLKNQALALSIHFNTEEWKKNEEDIKKNAEKIKLYFNSDQWKAQQQQLDEHSKEIQLKLNSTEFKSEMDKAKQIAKEIQIHFNTPLFRQKLEATKTLEKSKAYRDLKKKFDEDIEALKKNLIKADTISF